jgi:hypothetical protein
MPYPAPWPRSHLTPDIALRFLLCYCNFLLATSSTVFDGKWKQKQGDGYLMRTDQALYRSKDTSSAPLKIEVADVKQCSRDMSDVTCSNVAIHQHTQPGHIKDVNGFKLCNKAPIMYMLMRKLHHQDRSPIVADEINGRSTVESAHEIPRKHGFLSHALSPLCC